MELSDVVLHPVRLRVVQQFLGDRHLTTRDLQDAMPDVPTASLYRHVRVLAEHDVLAVVQERQVRGGTERTYELRSAVVGPEDARVLTPAEHRQAFLWFVSTLVADFDRYLAGPNLDPAEDRVGYRQVGLHLSDAELDQLMQEMSAVLVRFFGRDASPERRLRILSTVLLPVDPPISSTGTGGA
ncbi:MAG TPA: ArsR family transcriptional regulator [Acidimicrobiaceae bacterium]|nr:ArsR family transcriptional regulator [Acidimicrobiaceae bacterium]